MKGFVRITREFLQSLEDGDDGESVLETMTPEEINRFFGLLNKNNVNPMCGGAIVDQKIDLSEYTGPIGIQDMNGNLIHNGDILTSYSDPVLKNKKYYGVVNFEHWPKYNGEPDGFVISYVRAAGNEEKGNLNTDGLYIDELNLQGRKTTEYKVVGNINNPYSVRSLLKAGKYKLYNVYK